MSIMAADSTLKLSDLPYDCLYQIFGYMSYHEVAQCRLICRHANFVCHKALSSGAENLRLKIGRIQSKLKAQLPRRESARRGHMASDLLEVVNSVENRVSIIRLALDRYLITGQLTFFPGKVLDEAFRIIAHIETLSTPARDGSPPLSPFSAMQKVAMLRDLRDLSTMASEHIDDIILPSIRQRLSSAEPFARFSNQSLVFQNRPTDHHACSVPSSPEKASSAKLPSSGFHSPSSSASNDNNDDPVIRLCGLFVEQFRSVTAHVEELKNQQKQSQNKVTQLATELNSVKQLLAQEQLFSASLAKKVEVAETALAEMRRLTMNANGTPVTHVCENMPTPSTSTITTKPTAKRQQSLSDSVLDDVTTTKRSKNVAVQQPHRVTRSTARKQ